MKAVIISGGTPPSEKLLKDELVGNYVLICADSGAKCAYEYKIIPDYIIGDFDSTDDYILKFFLNKKSIIETYPIEKDYTDTELAVIKALELKVDKIVFLGCTGTRLDHTFGNLALLYKCLDNNTEAFIKDNNNIITMVNHSVIIKGQKGDKFSIFAYNKPIINLSIFGAKYSLNKYILKIGDNVTISNEFVNNEVKIDFESGNLIIMKSID
ncbi:thiamine pyrophosphokinase [Clostridium sp. USBA 49]|jgi:thiamine pyrophosphokinase|uniref:thiamine diphosphokinase n=1 Tax=Clostridium TaxID=1485 RepID=UPI0009999DD4|nr:MULTISPECIES: thiamine diphosphokinase [Clostridium]SKA76240.1 thiamine pyrophosphokinase [Clostridium sp. USBA 49]